MLAQASRCDQVIDVLRATHDGDLLSPGDLAKFRKPGTVKRESSHHCGTPHDL